MTVLALRPYADLEGIFEKLEYRSSPTTAFKSLPLDGDSVQHLVRMDDLRIIPRHEFKVKLDVSRLKPHYNKHKPSLRMVVLTRDSMLRREIVLSSHNLDSLPDVITLRVEDLRLTGHRDRLPLEFVVVAVPVIDDGTAMPTQKASRLAELQVTLLNASGGAAFPYRRATIEQLDEKGLLAETGIHLELFCGAEELVKDTDTPPHSLFEVWINEKLWDAMQNDGAGPASQLRAVSVSETTATMVLAAVIPALKAGHTIEDGSVVGQLIGFAEKQAGKRHGELRKQYQQDFALTELISYIQAALRYATVASKIDVDDGEGQ